MKPKITALAIAGACAEKKALDILLIKMKRMSSVCDYFVIASGTSTTQVGAIADNVIRRLKEKRQRARHVEGLRDSLWVLLDYGDVVCHVFLDETRRYYDLERLWKAAPRERYREPRAGKSARRAILKRPKSRRRLKRSKRRKISR